MRLFDRSFEDQIGEDDSTLDGHWDLESAAVSDDALYRDANKQTLRIPKMPKMESTLKTALFQDVKDHLTVYHALSRVRQKDL
ncbi:hypothetical protein BG003_002074 [Podila horticola]|nr:hypothetical protein BG003_002074 [Podila horticola]